MRPTGTPVAVGRVLDHDTGKGKTAAMKTASIPQSVRSGAISTRGLPQLIKATHGGTRTSVWKARS